MRPRSSVPASLVRPLAVAGALLSLAMPLVAVPLDAQDTSVVVQSAEKRDADSRRRPGRPRPRVRENHGWYWRTVERLDDALAERRRDWDRLSPAERERIRLAFKDLFPRENHVFYEVNEAQARALVWMAFGGGGSGGSGREVCTLPGRDCGEAMERASEEAMWLYERIQPLRRGSSTIMMSDEQDAALRQIVDGSRRILVETSGCGCTAARTSAESLLDLAREMHAEHRRTRMSPWMISEEKLATMQQLARQIERDALRCGDVRGR